LLTADNSARVSITFLISTIRAISLYDRQEFHLMTDKFHFMTDKFHLMTELTQPHCGFRHKVKSTRYWNQ